MGHYTLWLLFPTRISSSCLDYGFLAGGGYFFCFSCGPLQGPVTPSLLPQGTPCEWQGWDSQHSLCTHESHHQDLT